MFCGALVGAGLGFLWFNAYPAQVFMGDVGSLALGGTPWDCRRDCQTRNRILYYGWVFLSWKPFR